ncbi:alpha-glucosidase [Bradyrhizobium sp. SRL28]|uniref:alpha-glucosidase n=1 Tax=Bradyrhizobium sp. SRL28 TaxID=2836178 RepID=UPI001BDF066F|nr:alpha-glucosidase [Bradyrhizobium sp. SRL28]MBT1517348.1 alpha-glucosidase [Bradyrhizobium sp. SRL28]
MKRRDFFSASAAAIVAAKLPHRASAQSTAGAAAETHSVGDFILGRTATGLQVGHKNAPDTVIWDTVADGNFIIAETATADIREFGTPEGSFEITDTVSASYEKPTIDAIAVEGNKAAVTGQLTGTTGSIGYKLTFEAISTTHLRFVITAEGANAASVNRIHLIVASAADEAIFGFGHQLTYFNQKGYVLPIITQEHGVGRGQPIITQAVDLMANRGGGTPFTTEAPAPHYLTSRLRSLFLENTEYSTFDMRPTDQIDIKLWSMTMTGRILYGESPLDLIETYTEYAGRMRVLPDWINNGLIIGTQGGTDVVRGKIDEANKAGIPLAGVWLQDWPGVRVTNVGKQLWWNWTLDETQYPGWKQLVADLESQGARTLIYINPFLSTENGHNSLYTEGVAKGYLVENADGTPFLNKNTNFSAALIDLSNPDTRTWIKNVIKTEMIQKAGASGWMHDFGEALPFTGKLHNGADPAIWHNRYAEEWTRVAREAIEEAGRGDDIVFFDRSGFTQSPGASTLFWLGDQIQDWSEYDGIKSVVVGLLSGGISGFSLNHSDTGGYVAFKIDVAGKEIPIIARTPELQMRWTELNAFTAVLRTHEGLVPPISAQFDTSPELLAHMARFAKVFKGLTAYRKRHVADAAARGYPLARHLFLHYPNDQNTFGLRYQYLLGPDLLVAPVVDKGATSVDVYFPKGAEWTDLWTGADAGKAGQWMKMPAPLAKPAVFLRKGAASADDILAGLRGVGVR